MTVSKYNDSEGRLWQLPVTSVPFDYSSLELKQTIKTHFPAEMSELAGTHPTERSIKELYITRINSLRKVMYHHGKYLNIKIIILHGQLVFVFF